MTFPGLASTFTTGTGVAQEMNCTQEFTHNVTTPTEISYATNANYQIIPFSSDFRYSDAPTRDPLATLNPNSNLVRSVYWPGDFCPNGGYPVNVSGRSHLVDRGRQHRLREQRPPPPIAAGASTNVDNSGSAGKSVNTTNTSAAGITQGSSTRVEYAGGDHPGQFDRFDERRDQRGRERLGGHHQPRRRLRQGAVDHDRRTERLHANSGDFQLVR